MSALLRLKVGLVVVALAGVGGVTAAVASGDGGPSKFSTDLVGYQEVPAISTAGGGTFRADISKAGDEVRWELTYGSLRGIAQQAHIHFGQTSVNGGISVFLCTDLGNGPVGTQACPDSGKVTGTFRAVDVIGPAGQGIAPGEYTELVKALRAGVAYANVHTDLHPGGEIRGQLDDRGPGRPALSLPQPRRRRPRGVAWKPAASSARPSGESSTPAPSARSTVSRPS